ncbi:MAG: hypothetical protein LAQ30_16480 [Acidobacteriia bacterium]|nr:hypothetical protein [Terriglobia bacterium]
MIRRVLFLLAVVATAAALPCFAQGVTPLNYNPYYIDSRCEFNPATPINTSAAHICTSQTSKETCEGYNFCWWRDTTNQNVISQHTADQFTDSVVALYTSPTLNVYVYLTPYSSNVVLVTTAMSYMIVNPGGSANEATSIKSKLGPYIAGKILRPLITVDAYPQSIWGSSVWTHNSPSAVVYASGLFDDALQEQFFVETEFTQRNQRTYGTFLPWGSDAFLGLGSGKEDRAVPPQSFTYPLVRIYTKTDISLDGNTISLIPTDAVMNGSLMVNLPGPHILIVGNSGTYLSDAGSIVRPNTNVTAWIDNLDYMRTVGASILVPVHGKPVIGASEVLSAILTQRDSLQYIRDQTVIKINQHIPLDDIAATMVFPESLANSPYAREFTSRISAIVRNVYQHYMGWFNGDPASLYAMDTTNRARRLIALAGNDNKALQYAQKCITEHTLDGAQNALEVAGALVKVSPSEEARAIYIQALKMLALSEKSAHYRNYYLSAILEMQ